MSSQLACRFDRACMRADCWFSHPNGRTMDEYPANVYNMGMVYGYNPNSAPVYPQQGMYVPNSQGVPPGALSRNGSTDSSDPYNPYSPRYGSPYETPAYSPSYTGPMPGMHSTVNPRLGMDPEETLAMLADPDIEMTLEEENALRDTWIPSSRNCNCCKGYIYGCEDPTCMSLGICSCIAAELQDQEIHRKEHPNADAAFDEETSLQITSPSTPSSEATAATTITTNKTDAAR